LYGICIDGISICSTLDILNERYARSEISDEEYKTKKAELSKG
jgi:uncharacterized membrane protein